MKVHAMYIASGLMLIGLIYQFVFRYDYVHLLGGNVMRIDRVTNSSCNMPCLPPPPTPMPTKFDWYSAGQEFAHESQTQDQDAISLAKSTPLAAQLILTAGPTFAWTAHTTDEAALASLRAIAAGNDAYDHTDGFFYTPPPINSPSFQTKYVCYCDSQFRGWSWEVHLDTRAVYSVDDNADLQKRYNRLPPK